MVYTFTPESSLGFTFQQGYRAGGVETTFAAPFFNEFDPEFTNNYEPAFRHARADGFLTVNANAFFTEWDDQQVFLLVNPPIAQTENAGRSQLWGGEVDLRVRPTADLELFFGLAYANTEFRDFNFNGTQLAGNQFIRAPEWSGAIGASYAFGNGFRVSGDLNYTGATFSDIFNTRIGTDPGGNPIRLRNSDYWIANVDFSYQLSPYAQVSFYVKNLFDERYTLVRGAGSVFTPPTQSVGPGREFGAFLTAEF